MPSPDQSLAVELERMLATRAATPDDVYRIGSITKTFAAVLIMQLVGLVART
jgi:CubicO group peptidase (beta-lactamase class C family)